MPDQSQSTNRPGGGQVSGGIAKNYASYVREIALGMKTVIWLAERCADARLENSAPPLDDYQLSTLLRLADRAAESLDEETADFEAFVEDAGGRAETSHG